MRPSAPFARPNEHYEYVTASRNPRKPLPLGSEKVDHEMQHLMAPFINAMRKEFRPRWPHLDAEMVLLKFIYMRNNMEPPEISILRKPHPSARGQRNQLNANQPMMDTLPPRPTTSMETHTNDSRMDTLPPRCTTSMDVRSSKNEAITLEPVRPQSSVGNYSRPESRCDQAEFMERSKASSPMFQHPRCGSALGTDRPESNLSSYKTRAECHTSASTRACDSRNSTRYADTPLEETGRWSASLQGDTQESHVENDGIDYYDYQFAKKMQNAQSLQPCLDRGHFRDFQLPEPSIDDCADTPSSIRQAHCLRERIEARRREAFNGLGNCASGLRSLDGVLQAVADDEAADHKKFSDPRKNVSGFAMQIAKVRQGLRGQFISKVPLLSLEVLSEEEQFWLVGKLAPRNYVVHDKIFSEGETGNELYIIESGTCTVTKEVRGEIIRICEIKTGEFFGEMAVMYDMPRNATVTAATSVKLLSLSRADIFSVVSHTSIEKMKVLTRMQLLIAIPALSKLSSEQRAKVLDAVRNDQFPAGTEIMREGYRTGRGEETGSNRRLYLLEEGVCTEARTNEPSMCETKCQSGACFGNLEMFFGCPQQSTVIAQTDVKLISISFDELQTLFVGEAELAFASMRASLRLLLLRQAHPLFQDKNEHTLGAVLEAGTFKRFAPWQVILNKDEPITCLMVLEEGTCVEHNGEVAALMNERCQNLQQCQQLGSCRCHDRCPDGVKSREHSRPGDTLESRDAIVAPWTLVAITACSVLFLPMQVLRSLRSEFQ